MPATPRKLKITAKDLEGPPAITGGTYSEIPTPSDQELYLADVNDYDKRPEKGHGWVFSYHVETSTGPCNFDVYLSFSESARWKIVDVFAAHGVDIGEVGIANADPNALIGDTIGGHIDFPRDADDEPTSTYREIQDFFDLADPPEEVEADEPVAQGGPEAEVTQDPDVL